MMAFHYFLLPHCYGSESSGADLEIGRRGSVHACAYAGWHTWDVGWWTKGAGSPPWLKLWQQHPGEYRQESCGKLQLQGDVHHSTPKGRAVRSRSPQSALLRPGLPWDRSFWRTPALVSCQPIYLVIEDTKLGFPWDPSHPWLKSACTEMRKEKKSKPVLCSTFNFLLMIYPYARPGIVMCRLQYRCGSEQRGQSTFSWAMFISAFSGLFDRVSHFSGDPAGR